MRNGFLSSLLGIRRFIESSGREVECIDSFKVNFPLKVSLPSVELKRFFSLLVLVHLAVTKGRGSSYTVLHALAIDKGTPVMR